MTGWQHRLSGHESERSPLPSNGGHRRPARGSPWGRRARHDSVTEPQQRRPTDHSVGTFPGPRGWSGLSCTGDQVEVSKVTQAFRICFGAPESTRQGAAYGAGIRALASVSYHPGRLRTSTRTAPLTGEAEP